MSTQLAPRKRPSQRRSEYTVDVVLEAAARILEEKGLEGFNTNAVADKAGISIGSLYQYFPRKEALTVALIVRSHQRIVDCLHTALEKTEHQSAEHAIRTTMRDLVRVQTAASRLNRILEGEEERLPRIPELVHLEMEIHELNQRLLARYIDMRRHSLVDLGVASMDVIALGRALLDAALITGEIDAEGLEDRLYRTVVGYLGPMLARPS